ncbi:MAG: diguanylate cyclase [Lawsonibacter sp.]
MGKQQQLRQKILIVDDSEIDRSILADMLNGEFEIIEAEDGRQAIMMMQRLRPRLSLVLLDTSMPGMDGFRVLETMKEKGWSKEIPVIMISVANVTAHIERAYDLGAVDYIQRPFHARIIRRRVSNAIMLYAKQKRLAGMVTDQIYERERAGDLMLEILSHIVEFRNGESGQHVLHIRSLTGLLLNRLVQKTDQYELTSTDISVTSYASALHDIGKIAIPESILNKPGPLTEEEFEIMKTHSLKGAAMLEHLPLRQHEPLVQAAYEICRWHHERYDGKGYPDRLAGEDIPISAQVVALADVYEALTSPRVYKTAYSHNRAITMILNGECGIFNPLLLECLADVSESVEEEIKRGMQERQLQWEVWNMAQEVGQHGKQTASDRTLRLLEHERTKYRFFASMSKEIQFEYTMVPDVLTLSEWGANYLGIGGVQIKLGDNPVMHQVMGLEAIRALREELMSTTPDQPVVEYCCAINIRGERRWGKIISRAMWSGDEPPKFQGAIGKFVDIHEEHSRIKALEQIAAHDGLTGLLNRDSAQKRIEALLTDHRDRNYALAVVDLDYFKNANDRYGHLFGDQVLKHIADKLRKSIRSSDLAARVGGDEFLVFVEYTDQVQAQADRIFQALLGEYEGFPVSVSMGIARSSGVDGGYEVLFRQADQALYAAKRKGRKRYCFYNDSMREMLSVLSPIESDGSGRKTQTEDDDAKLCGVTKQ